MPRRSDNRKELPADAQFVQPHDAADHGYWGTMPDTSDDRQYHVDGVEEDYLDKSSRQSAATTSTARHADTRSGTDSDTATSSSRSSKS